MPLPKRRDQKILHRVFTQIMVDAIDLRFVENAQHRPVQLARGGQVAAERLLDDQARPGLCRSDSAPDARYEAARSPTDKPPEASPDRTAGCHRDGAAHRSLRAAASAARTLPRCRIRPKRRRTTAQKTAAFPHRLACDSLIFAHGLDHGITKTSSVIFERAKPTMAKRRASESIAAQLKKRGDQFAARQDLQKRQR